MKVKKEYIILGVVIVALVGYLVSRKQDRNLYDLPQIESVQAKEITRVERTMAGETTTFRKEGSDWKISPENYAADAQKVKEWRAARPRRIRRALISESKIAFLENSIIC